MKILVTGSSGFVGKRVVKALREKGHSVKEFDLDKGLDLLREKDCRKATKGIETVVHAGAILDENSPLLWRVNVRGTENILKAGSENGVERFIHLSTVGVHGEQSGRVNEKSPFNPVTAYEKSKAKAEKIVQEYREMVYVTILRPAIVLGPNEYWKKIIGLMEKDYPLIGNGKNKWQTIYIKDLVNAIVFCVENSEARDETLIIAEENALSLEELCVELKKELGLKPKMKRIPFWLGKTLAYLYITFSSDSLLTPSHLKRLNRNREYSIEKIKKIGWKPEYSTKQAIRETVKELGQNKPKL